MDFFYLPLIVRVFLLGMFLIESSSPVRIAGGKIVQLLFNKEGAISVSDA